jgi:hypothetical protein
MDKSPLIKQLEESGIIVDVITICPYCGTEATAMMWQLGCCGESSDHFIEGYLFNDDSFLTEEQVHALYKSGSIH